MELLRRSLRPVQAAAVAGVGDGEALVKKLLLVRPSLRIGGGAHGAREIKHFFFGDLDWAALDGSTLGAPASHPAPPTARLRRGRRRTGQARVRADVRLGGRGDAGAAAAQEKCRRSSRGGLVGPLEHLHAEEEEEAASEEEEEEEEGHPVGAPPSDEESSELSDDDSFELGGSRSD